MASKRLKKRQSCTGKHRYFTQDNARTAAASLKRDKGLLKVHAYHCPFCKTWHVGRQKL